MLKTLFGLLLLLVVLICPVYCLPPVDSTGIGKAAQDGAGTVWAFGTGNPDIGKILRWSDGQWSAEAVPGAEGFRLKALTEGAGNVYALWQAESGGPNETPQSLITVQHGIGSRVLARFPAAVVHAWGAPNVPSIFAGVAGDVWVAGYQPLLWHISQNGTVTTFPLTPSQFFGGALPDGNYLYQTFSIVDGMGRRWFWQQAFNGDWQPHSLRGVLVWDGATLAYHPTLLGVPDRPFTVIAPLDASHLWLGAGDDYLRFPVQKGALYRLDIRTLAATRDPNASPDAFRHVTQVFAAHGDCYALAQPEYGVGMPSLWRQHAGRWRLALGSAENPGGYYGPSVALPMLNEADGTWLGVTGGAWWLARGDQPPLWADWRRGVPDIAVSHLFRTTNGNILAVGETGAGEMPPTPQPIRPLPPRVISGGPDAPKHLWPFLSDSRKRLWGCPQSYAGACPLYEWDGNRWQTHLVPKNITGIYGLYACDTLGRLWLATSNWNPPAQPQPVYGYVIYDPSRDTWTNYATTQFALQAAAALPGMAFLPHRDLYQPPCFSGNGRVTYADTDNNGIDFFDGLSWRHWSAHDISPHYSYVNLTNPPQFSNGGNLEVVLNQEIWIWTPVAGWQLTGTQAPTYSDNGTPPGGPRGLWLLATVDDLGRKWFVWQGAVYTAWQGLWAKQEDLSGTGSPFRYGYTLQDVLRDASGHLVFVSQPAGSYDLVVWTPPPTPRPMVAVIPTAEDAVTVRVRSDIRGPHWMLWRLNGGAWSAPKAMAAKASEIRLAGMPHGDYRLEVQVLDQRLQPSPTAASAFSIAVTPGTQIAHWVHTLLSGTDDAREAAVAGLVKQPEVALPALQAARPGASEAGQWWLDAAIQQIKDSDQSQ